MIYDLDHDHRSSLGKRRLKSLYLEDAHGISAAADGVTVPRARHAADGLPVHVVVVLRTPTEAPVVVV